MTWCLSRKTGDSKRCHEGLADLPPPAFHSSVKLEERWCLMSEQVNEKLLRHKAYGKGSIKSNQIAMEQKGKWEKSQSFLITDAWKFYPLYNNKIL